MVKAFSAFRWFVCIFIAIGIYAVLEGLGWERGCIRMVIPFHKREGIFDVCMNIGISEFEVDGEGVDKRVDRNVEFGKSFLWMGPKGEAGSGLRDPLQKQFRDSKTKGFPEPVTWLFEYLSIDEDGMRLGRNYRTTGWFCRLLNTGSLFCWVTGCVASMSVVSLSCFWMISSGVMLLMSVASYTLLRNKNIDLSIPFVTAGGGYQYLTLAYGWCYWLSIALGVVILSIGVGLLTLNKKMPEVANYILDIQTDVKYSVDPSLLKHLSRKKMMMLAREAEEKRIQQEAEVVTMSVHMENVPQPTPPSPDSYSSWSSHRLPPTSPTPPSPESYSSHRLPSPSITSHQVSLTSSSPPTETQPESPPSSPSSLMKFLSSISHPPSVSPTPPSQPSSTTSPSSPSHPSSTTSPASPSHPSSTTSPSSPSQPSSVTSPSSPSHPSSGTPPSSGTSSSPSYSPSVTSPSPPSHPSPVKSPPSHSPSVKSPSPPSHPSYGTPSSSPSHSPSVKPPSPPSHPSYGTPSSSPSHSPSVTSPSLPSHTSPPSYSSHVLDTSPPSSPRSRRSPPSPRPPSSPLPPSSTPFKPGQTDKMVRIGDKYKTLEQVTAEKNEMLEKMVESCMYATTMSAEERLLLEEGFELLSRKEPEEGVESNMPEPVDVFQDTRQSEEKEEVKEEKRPKRRRRHGVRARSRDNMDSNHDMVCGWCGMMWC